MSQLNRRNNLDLASWNLPDVVIDHYKKQGVVRMFPWQAQCLQTGAALQGGNLLYSAPTSAGKTLVAEILALKRILKTKRKGIFILPFVSVAREKMFSLRALYSGLGLTVGGFMGAQTPPGGFKKVDIAVCTIERANSLINRLLEADKLSQLTVIVVDELHMVGDASRGCLIEPLLTKVNFHVTKSMNGEKAKDNSVQIIGMSATLPNMHLLSKWLKADLYCTDYRPVPLTEYVKLGSSILDAQLKYVRDVEVPGAYDNDSEMIVNLCIETIKQGKSVLIFCPAKEWCERLCTNIARSLYLIMAGKVETSDVLCEPVTQAINKERILELLEQLKRSPAGLVEQLRISISYGVAFHHAGLTLEEKDIIEGGFRSSVIRVLVATTTLSSGVNLPAQRVIIRSPLFMGKSMDVLTYKQMAGRAGRKGIDSYGESILICKPTEKRLVADLLNSELPAATSKLVRRTSDGGYILRPSVRRALLEMIASGVATSVEMIQKYISCTLLAAEIDSNDGNASQLVEDCLESLKDDEFINIEKGEDGSDLLTPTQLGRAVFASSMNPDDSLTIHCDLNKARKQFVLENELHMVYQVTPINSIHSDLDWVKYLNLWETLPGDQQRVGDLVGVSERFIMLSQQGRRRRGDDKQYRSLQIHRRFYTALILHDLVNEMTLMDIERKYGVNKGTVQALQQNAAIFAGMVCTFCSKLGWTPLRLLLADFQQRLDTGVRRELVDLVRISCLDSKQARHLYNSGLQTVSDVVNSNVGQISQLLRSFLPFESSKQGYGETEQELKDRKARMLVLKGRSRSVGITEAAQLIMQEAREVLQDDLEILGVDGKVRILKGESDSSVLSTSQTTDESEPGTDKQVTTTIPVSHQTDSKHAGEAADNTVDCADNPSSSRSSLGHERLEEKQTIPDGIKKYNQLLDNFERSVPSENISCTSSSSLVEANAGSVIVDQSKLISSTANQSHPDVPSTSLSKNSDIFVKRFYFGSHATDQSEPKCLTVSQSDAHNSRIGHSDATSSTEQDEPSLSESANSSSVLWEDSFLFPSQENRNEKTPERVTTPDCSVSLSSSLCSLDDLPSDQSVKKRRIVKRRSLSPDLTYTRLKPHKRIRTSTIKRRSSQLSQQSGASQDHSHRSHLPEYSSASNPMVHVNQSLCQDAITPIRSHVDESSIISNHPFSTERSGNKSASDSADLFSKSMDSLIWSPMPDSTCGTPNRSLLAKPESSPVIKKEEPVPDTLDNPSKLQTTPKIEIVNVSQYPQLFKTFLSDWSEATEYSLSLACGENVEEVTQDQDSIGLHSSDAKISLGERRLSNSTSVSPEGVVLEQYGVVVVGVAITLKSVVYYIDLSSDVEQKLDAIRKMLVLPHSTKVMFDGKEHMKRLSALLGTHLDLGPVLDPKVIVWMLEPDAKEYNLPGVIRKAAPWFDSVFTKNIGVCVGNGSVGLTPHASASPRLRACYEALAMTAVLKPLLAMIDKQGLRHALTNVEMPHLACLARMESDGLGIDVEEIQKQSAGIIKVLRFIQSQAQKYAKRRLDLNSAKDIGEVLFVDLRLPYERKKVVSKKRAPWSTAQAQLNKISSLHPLPGMVLLWRKLHMALTKLAEPLQKRKVWCEKKAMYRIYSTCSLQTSTGRVTMHEPNLQTINKDISVQLPDLDEQVISLRNAFPAAPGYTLLSADYSQLELRIISHLASDSTLLSLLNGGGDVFKDIASRWKSVPADDVTDEQRQNAKQICYGIIYGMGSKALSEQLSVDEDTAEQLMRDFQTTFIGLKTYLISTVESCRKLGYVSTIVGRRRYLPNINNAARGASRSQAERQAINTTVQGSAADLVKMATINLESALNREARLVLQIHDELLYEVPTPLLKQTARVVKHTMESVGDALQLSVNMVVRIKTGPTWSQLQPLDVL